MTIQEVTTHLMQGGQLTAEEALQLANDPDKEALYEAAHQVTRHFMGNKFDTCSIINAKSGNCSEDCKWCAQSGHYATKVHLYPLLPAEECVRHAVYNRKQGIGRFALVTSGKRVSDKDMQQITDTVRTIKELSFKNVSVLREIVWPASLETIHAQAFEGTALTALLLPEGVSGIGEKAFFGCTSLESVTLPDSLDSLGHDAFGGCTSLTALDLGDGQYAMGERVFADCTALETVVIPDGVENYHCNIETAPSYFGKLCTTHTIAQKMETIRMAREIGFRICCGGIVGMGESMEQRIEMALFLREAGVHSIPINLLHPIAGTPLQDTPPMSEEEWLTTIALFRLINPTAYLRFSGGRAQLSEALQRKSLYVGVNAAIIGDLLTTIGSQVEEDKRLFTEAGYSLTEQTDWVG